MGKGRIVRTVTRHFPTPDDVIRVCDLPCPEDAYEASREESPSERWDLGAGWDGAYDAYCGGWAEGAHKAYALAETLKPRPQATRTVLKRSMAGAFPNVPAYLAGHPQAMFQPVKRHAQGRPFVHLYVPLAYSGSIKAETAFNRGCALVAIIDALETSGCRVRVTGVDSSESESLRYVATYDLKAYGARLDVDTLIFTVAHPAFLRRIMFAHIERCNDAGVRKLTHMGYGVAVPTHKLNLPEDGHGVTVRFPELPLRAQGTPESFLREMVTCLPESLRTEIAG